MGLKARASARKVAFLRGMNLGRRRITNVELCAVFSQLGFDNVEAFLASGNVVFETRRAERDLEAFIAAGLERLLNYSVPTFVRSADEVHAIAACDAFSPEAHAQSNGKVQVILFAQPPAPAQRDAALAQDSAANRMALVGREMYWLPVGGLSESDLDVKAIEAVVGTTTIRTKRTLERIAAKYF